MHSIFRWTAALLLALGMALSAHADDTAAQIRQHAGDHACWYWVSSTAPARPRCWYGS